MNSTLYDAIALSALIMASIAAMAAFVSISLVVGLKNSTHQVVWKQMEEPKVDSFDPFATGEEEKEFGENPNKRHSTNTTANDQEDFADLDNPEVSSNFN
jgi:arylsulfatase A-like enzyme